MYLPICAKGIQEELTVTNKHGYFLAVSENREEKREQGKGSKDGRSNISLEYIFLYNP